MIAPVADGPGWNPLMASADEVLTVHGVVIGVDPPELRRVALRVREAGALVDQAVESVRRAGYALSLTRAYDDVSGTRAHSATWSVVASWSRLGAGIAELGDDLLAAYREYLARERAATEYLTFGRGALPGGPMCVVPFDPPVPHPVLGLHALPNQLAYTLFETVVESWREGRWTPSGAQMGVALRFSTAAFLDAFGIRWALRKTGYEDHPWLDSPVHSFAALTAAVSTGGISTRVRVRKVPAPRPEPARAGADPRPNTDLAGLTRSIGDLYPDRGAEPGTVRVDRIVASDGSVSWQVLVPGTQSAHGMWGGQMPMDWASNLQIYAGEESASSAAVIAAMRAAGVGRDEPVLIAGHSQGGLIAADLASRADVAAEFTISSVLSLGAPTGHIDIPEGIATLHIDHVDDLVAGLDDTPNPVTPDRTTITRDVNAATAWHSFGSVRDSHDIPAYTRTAELADASTDPAVRDWLHASAAMLDPRAEVTSTYVQATRVD